METKQTVPRLSGATPSPDTLYLAENNLKSNKTHHNQIQYRITERYESITHPNRRLSLHTHYFGDKLVIFHHSWQAAAHFTITHKGNEWSFSSYTILLSFISSVPASLPSGLYGDRSATHSSCCRCWGLPTPSPWSPSPWSGPPLNLGFGLTAPTSSPPSRALLSPVSTVSLMET